MITIQFYEFSRWRTVAQRHCINDARTFVATHAPINRRWVDSVRFVVDGCVIGYAEACGGK